MNSARENLIEKRRSFPKLRPSSFSTSEIESISISSSDWEDLKFCISSDDINDNICGLIFLVHISDKYAPTDLQVDVLQQLIKKLPIYMVHEDYQLRTLSYGFFVSLRGCFDNYRDKMLALLKGEDLEGRRLALRNYATFAKSNEVSPLIEFKDDEYAAEQKMAGPYVYEFRNYALSLIEDVTGINYGLAELSEEFDGSVVSWRSWEKFLQWWVINQSKFV